MAFWVGVGVLVGDTVTFAVLELVADAFAVRVVDGDAVEERVEVRVEVEDLVALAVVDGVLVLEGDPVFVLLLVNELVGDFDGDNGVDAGVSLVPVGVADAAGVPAGVLTGVPAAEEERRLGRRCDGRRRRARRRRCT